MCGLSVVQGTTHGELSVMNESMSHRGTTKSSSHRRGWGLGRVRLPIVGLSEGFDAPYEHKGFTFNFVGELVNFREMVPTAQCDVEVLARNWVSSGPTCMRRFDGFWSVAVVDPAGALYVATDFLGKKPVYYRTDRVAYASEIRALCALGPVEPDRTYFSSVSKWGYHAGERTWAKQVRKMTPGTLRIHHPNGTLEEFRDFDPIGPSWEVNLKTAIVRSVRRRVLSSDVPVAMLLSGGLDSSIIYALAREARSDLMVYHAPNDEADYLGLLGVDPSTATEVNFSQYPDEEVLRANEGPVDLGSVFPQYALGQAVRERVALSGDGADELFGGYRRSLEYDSQGSDVFEELVHYHLPRLDKLMMAGTVELRSPFLGREVVAGALALPREQRTAKRFLKEAFADLLPREILERPKTPLKTRRVIDGGVAERMRLCDLFERMIEEKRT